MTNTTEAEEAVLKTDVLGRIRTPRERREKILDEFDGSGLSGRKFAELTGINYQTAPKISTKPVSHVRWLEAVVEQKKLPAGSGQSILAVHLPGGARMEIADATQAALATALLWSLENKPALSC